MREWTLIRMLLNKLGLGTSNNEQLTIGRTLASVWRRIELKNFLYYVFGILYFILLLYLEYYNWKLNRNILVLATHN